MFGSSGSVVPRQVQGTVEDAALQFTRAAVITMDGKTAFGPIVLHRSADVLVLSSVNRTVPAMQVISFEVAGQLGHVLDLRKYYDFALMRQGYFPGNPNFTAEPEYRKFDEFRGNLQRLYVTYRWNGGNDFSDYLTPGFFEQLSSGPVVLLYRTSLKLKPVNEMAFAGDGNGSSAFKVAEKGRFYLGLPSGKAVLLANPYAYIMSYFPTHASQIRAYAQQQKLEFTRAHELAYIINYANSLLQASSSAVQK